MIVTNIFSISNIFYLLKINFKFLLSTNTFQELKFIKRIIFLEKNGNTIKISKLNWSESFIKLHITDEDQTGSCCQSRV